MLVDVDRDGDLDIVVASYGDIYVLENTGNGLTPGFSPSGFYLDGIDGATFGEAISPQLVDIDGDGDLDLFVNAPYIETSFTYESGPPWDYYYYLEEQGEFWFFENLVIDWGPAGF